LGVAIRYYRQARFEAAVKIFDEMCYKQLLPIHEIDKDATRKGLDERFAREVTGPTGIYASTRWSVGRAAQEVSTRTLYSWK
jgi:hypothetical protein